MKRTVTIFILVLIASVGMQAGKPVIGIAPGGTKGTISVKENYIRSIEKAGGIPFILPLVKDKAMAREIVARIDGLLMTGGEDINPAYYREEVLNESVYVNAPRDTSDLLVLAAARKRGIPILGICRGEQIINVFYGGTLYQDIPSQVEDCLAHKQTEPASTGTHTIRIKKSSRLHKLLGVDTIAVNSFHHQAVKKLAAGFKVSATADDGVIEAYENGKVMCVQFHPEGFVNAGDDRFLPIFSDFVQKAGKSGRR